MLFFNLNFSSIFDTAMTEYLEITYKDTVNQHIFAPNLTKISRMRTNVGLQ